MPRQETIPLLTGRNLQDDRRRFLAAGCILLLTLLERLAFYSFSSNFYVYLTRLVSINTALLMMFMFFGVSYFCSFVGGLVGDLWLNRFVVMAAGYVLFSVAYIILPFSVFDSRWQLCEYSCYQLNGTSTLFDDKCGKILISLSCLIAVGSGIAQGNMVVFGAEQITNRGQSFLSAYMTWLYFCINVGGLVATVGIDSIQQAHSFFLGYIVPASVMLLVTLMFIFSYRIYVHEPCTKTFRNIINIVREAYKCNKRFNASHGQIQDAQRSPELLANRPSWLDMAKAQYGGKYHEAAVEDIKALTPILIVFLFLVPYWMLYFQMQSSFLGQGLMLRFTKNESHTTELEIPPAAMISADCISLLLTILLFYWLERRYAKIPVFGKLIIGMIFAAFAMFSAAVVETLIQNRFKSNDTIYQEIHKVTYRSVNLSIASQIPQYSLMGISEFFCIITEMDFAFSQAPTSMRGAIMGFLFSLCGISSFLGLGTMSAFEKLTDCNSTTVCNHGTVTVAGDNNCDARYYFVFLGGLELVVAFLFYYVCGHLKIRRHTVQLAGAVHISSESRVNLHGSQASSSSLFT